jgi:hypothetical protein
VLLLLLLLLLLLPTLLPACFCYCFSCEHSCQHLLLLLISTHLPAGWPDVHRLTLTSYVSPVQTLLTPFAGLTALPEDLLRRENVTVLQTTTKHNNSQHDVLSLT